MLGYDDSLDAFGVHGIGGIVGALGTAVVASPSLGGTGVWDYVANGVAEYSMATQLISQAWGSRRRNRLVRRGILHRLQDCRYADRTSG